MGKVLSFAEKQKENEDGIVIVKNPRFKKIIDEELDRLNDLDDSNEYGEDDLVKIQGAGGETYEDIRNFYDNLDQYVRRGIKEAGITDAQFMMDDTSVDQTLRCASSI